MFQRFFREPKEVNLVLTFAFRHIFSHLSLTWHFHSSSLHEKMKLLTNTKEVMLLYPNLVRTTVIM